MKNGNWKSILWALTGFLILGFGLDYGMMWVFGALILASWLVYVFWSYLKK